MVSKLPEDMNGVVTTAAADHLFKMRADTPRLNNGRVELFHRVTAYILVVVQHGSPNPRITIAFLPK